MYFCTLNLSDMKKHLHLLAIAALLVMVAGLTSCIKTYKIEVSTYDLWFDLHAGSKTLDFTANCKWTITKNDDADWYTISETSGKNDASITITVEELTDADFRGSSFIINSPNGHVHRTVFVTQNKLEFYSILNKVYGVMQKERWNTDYAGQLIEDTYVLKEYDPYDTTRGYHMYFLENGTGVQRDHHTDTVAWWLFFYEYDPVNQILHIDFPSDTTMNYAPEVLTASDSLFRFMHEFKPHYFERADMRKVGTINPAAKSSMMQRAVRRKERGPIFLD